MAEPKFTESSTDIFAEYLVSQRTDTPLPMRATARSESEEPSDEKFSTETAPPNRAKERIESDEPRLMKSTSEACEETRAIVATETPLPMRAYERRLMELPSAHKLNTEMCFPNRPWLRTEIEDPRCAQLITDNFNADPIDVRPFTESELVSRANDRSEHEEPKLAKFRIETELDIRPKDLKLMEDPRCAQFTTESIEAPRTLPATDIEDPNIPMQRRLMLLPIEAKFSTDTALPKRAPERRLIEEPRFKKSTILT
jgi:hypothetical protein